MQTLDAVYVLGIYTTGLGVFLGILVTPWLAAPFLVIALLCLAELMCES